MQKCEQIYMIMGLYCACPTALSLCGQVFAVS